MAGGFTLKNDTLEKLPDLKSFFQNIIIKQKIKI